MVNANHVRPCDLISLAFGQRLNSRLGGRRGRRRLVSAALMRQKRERNTEDVDVFRVEEACAWICLIGSAPKPPSHYLLAKQLRSEGAKTHDVRDGLCVPPF